MVKMIRTNTQLWAPVYLLADGKYTWINKWATQNPSNRWVAATEFNHNAIAQNVDGITGYIVENLQGRWSTWDYVPINEDNEYLIRFSFELEQDAMLFKMKYG